MEQYREIGIKEAMEMVANDDLDNLYFKVNGGALDQAKGYSVNFSKINKKQYFKKETIE